MSGYDYRSACVIMAAGQGSRYGDNKLMLRFKGKRLFEYAFDAAALTNTVAVVAASGLILEEANIRGYMPVLNDKPQQGISRSIALGIDAILQGQNAADAIMFMVADQPFINSVTVNALWDCWAENRRSIVAPAHNGKRGNPVIFPQALFMELRSLRGDNGGSIVIQRHNDSLLLYETEAVELMDIDTAADMEYAKTIER